MGPIYSPETLVTDYHSTLCKIPEECGYTVAEASKHAMKAHLTPTLVA